MATATIRIKKDTTANWTESGRVLDDGELGLEITEEGHRVIRVGDGVSAFMDLPVAVDIEAINEIKTGMDTNAKKYYDDMVDRGEEMLKKMEQQAITVELQDDETAASSQPPWKSSMRPASARAARAGSMGISASRGRLRRFAASAVLPSPKRRSFFPQSGQRT